MRSGIAPTVIFVSEQRRPIAVHSLPGCRDGETEAWGAQSRIPPSLDIQGGPSWQQRKYPKHIPKSADYKKNWTGSWVTGMPLKEVLGNQGPQVGQGDQTRSEARAREAAAPRPPAHLAAAEADVRPGLVRLPLRSISSINRGNLC